MWYKNSSSISIFNFSGSSDFLQLSSPYIEKVNAIANSKVKVLAKTSTRSFVSTVANALVYLTKILLAVIFSWLYGGKRCENTCGGTGLEIDNGRDEKNLIQNLTERKRFKSKSDTFWNFQVKFWHVVFFASHYLTHCKSFDWKLCLMKKHEKCQMCRFHGVRWTKTWFIECELFFKDNHVENFLIQNLTCCKSFNSQSDVLCFLQFKSWHVAIFSFQNLIFKSSFQIRADILSKCYQHQRTTCWKTTMVRIKKIKYECVACVCLTYRTILLVIAFFIATGFSMSVMTISFAILFDLVKILCTSESG